MTSIRRSMLLYGLVLLVSALTGVAWLLYRTTSNTLAAKEESTHRLLVAKHEERVRAENTRLDNSLLQQARIVASLVQSQTKWSKTPYRPLLSLGLLTIPGIPSAYCTVPVWCASAVGPGDPSQHDLAAFASKLDWILASELKLKEDEAVVGEEHPEMIQIDSDWVGSWRSRSMGSTKFEFHPETFQKMALFSWDFENVTVDGATLRLVSLKSPITRFRMSWRPWRPPGRDRDGRERDSVRDRDGPREPRGPRPPPIPQERVSPAVLVRYAGPTTDRDAAIAQLDEELRSELQNLRDTSRQTLQGIQARILAIVFVTCCLALIGGYFVVSRQLAPLQRLSEAVSQISAKDFRLPYEDPRTPAELDPIVARLKQTLDLLRRTFAREKQAVADLSHELRTPLAALLTTTDLALRKERKGEEYREFLQDCKHAGQQMNHLVERLLTLARLDAGVDQIRPRTIDVDVLAQSCVSLVRPLAEVRGLRLELQAHGETRVSADPDKLREVLTNLLHNAIEYNRPEGSVRVQVGRFNGHVNVEVADTGIGIPETAQQHIFERFYRVDPARCVEGQHAGLGLAISKEYVERMGGEIRFQSKEGEGTTFFVQLPGLAV